MYSCININANALVLVIEAKTNSPTLFSFKMGFFNFGYKNLEHPQQYSYNFSYLTPQKVTLSILPTHNVTTVNLF